LLVLCASLAPASAVAQQGTSVDLIQALHLPIAVGSTVGNNSDRPEHLVDGNLETAWNSHTGNLQGFNAFYIRVPDGATVEALRMTAGFTRTTARGDLFTQNHRVRRITVQRSGPGPAFERSFDLDINRRDLQTFPLGLGGGLFTVRIDATEPGTRRNWREACVSELQLLGRGSFPPWRLPEPLVVDVGMLSPAPTVIGPFPTAQALCANRRADRDTRRCRQISTSECGCRLSRAPAVTAQLPPGAPNPVLGVQIATVTSTPDESPTCWLAVQTAAGWSALSLAACGNPDATASNLAGYVRASTGLRALTVSHGPDGEPVLRVQYSTDEGMLDPARYDHERATGPYSERTRRSLAVQCRIAAGRLECLHPQAIAPTRAQ